MDLNPPRLAKLKKRLKDDPIVFVVDGVVKEIGSLDKLEAWMSFRRKVPDYAAREDDRVRNQIAKLPTLEQHVLERLVGDRGRKR